MSTPRLFRPQRGSLASAMAEVREFDGTWAGLQALIAHPLASVETYGKGIDERIGWDTHVVLSHWPEYPSPIVEGFTDGPVTKEQEG